jgi:hypothetical protein
VSEFDSNSNCIVLLRPIWKLPDNWEVNFTEFKCYVRVMSALVVARRQVYRL